MRFTKGTEVEVMERGELPFQSWKPAKIVKGNGHTYIIKYDNCAMEGSLIAGKVPRKLLRPRPPPMQQKSHNIGEIVEVFENYSWRLAEILGALSKNIVVVRLFGSSKEINVPLFLMRVPSTWKDNHWNTPLMVLKCGAADDMMREKYGRRKKRPFPSMTRASKKMRTTVMGKEIGFDDVSLSSVASCSFNNGSYNSAGHKLTKRKKFNGLVDDAESFSNIPNEMKGIDVISWLCTLHIGSVDSTYVHSLEAPSKYCTTKRDSPLAPTARRRSPHKKLLFATPARQRTYLLLLPPEAGREPQPKAKLLTSTDPSTDEKLQTKDKQSDP
ncbi:hypothetical protein KFK09_006916 [Dendrobium nobile]|uniref:Agenet domain-containing protein n=1 Tax=Dendrobium nobile TaxID=94219 RepID=A0A8T3BQT8_DENNO|nr:hypothetical protein KFK09_006916 [Dendrobium nobile]